MNTHKTLFQKLRKYTAHYKVDVIVLYVKCKEIVYSSPWLNDKASERAVSKNKKAQKI